MSYISGYGVHWRIRGRQSCGVAIYGDGCWGGECCWGGNIVIHKSAGVDKRTTKGDGNWDAWVRCCSKKNAPSWIELQF
jgi:hypothetical protein